MANTKEIWKKIRGYRGRYEISNKGRIRSWAYGRYPIKSRTPKYLKLNEWNGEYYFQLVFDYKLKVFRAANLVAKYFKPRPSKGLVISYKDGNKGNVKMANLVWVRPRETAANKVRLKLNEKKVKEIWKLLNKGLSFNHIARRYEVAPMLISKIKSGKTWKGVL